MTTTIAIVGGGYAGLFAAHRAARTVRRAPPAVRVVLVDPNGTWQERTRWHQLATGQTLRSRDREQVFRGEGVEVVAGRVTDVKLDERHLVLADAERSPLPFDRLIYTAGSRSSAHLVPGAERYAHTLDTAATSQRLAEALAQQPTARVVVVGAGLTGIQTASETAERYPSASVTLVGSGGVGAELTEAAREHMLSALHRLRVRIVEGPRVESVTADGIQWAGEKLASDLVVWTAGFTASPLAAASGLQVNTAGQVEVDAALRSLSHPFVFAAGDGAAVPRASSPYGAYAAAATGATAGRNAALDATDRPVQPLSMGYLLQGVSLGRRDAAVQVLRPDGTPRRRLLTGRLAARVKDAVEGYVSFSLGAERTIPGLYNWSPAPRDTTRAGQAGEARNVAP